MNPSFSLSLRMADNALVLGQRLSEWCGHGPVLEQDIALTNMALDLVGQARSWYQYAGELEGKGRSEDDLAFLRTDREFFNCLLVEQPNTDWAYTITRSFFFDAFHHLYLRELLHCPDAQVQAIAEKSLKEVIYHLRFSSEWMIRLGDGTETSRRKMQDAVDALWMYTGELTQPDDLDSQLFQAGLAPDLNTLRQPFLDKVQNILEEATLQLPPDSYMQTGGKTGIHTEHLGHLLAEMQVMQRTLPGLQW